jgi:hypothetical protein
MKAIFAVIASRWHAPSAFAQLASHDAVDAENLRYLRQQQDEERNAPTLYEQQARIDEPRARIALLQQQLEDAKAANGE